MFASLANHASDLPESQILTLLITAALRAIRDRDYRLEIPLKFADWGDRSHRTESTAEAFTPAVPRQTTWSAADPKPQMRSRNLLLSRGRVDVLGDFHLTPSRSRAAPMFDNHRTAFRQRLGLIRTEDRRIYRVELLFARIGVSFQPSSVRPRALTRSGLSVSAPHGARHSWCSYHLAQGQNAARTALEAGHDESVLFSHYRALVTPSAAREYWAIVPG